jgi:hypothetical protein
MSENKPMPSSLQSFEVALPEAGERLVLSFRGSAKEASIRLLGKTPIQKIFEGASTLLDVDFCQSNITRDFFNAVHGLITGEARSLSDPIKLIDSVIGKEIQIETLPLRQENMVNAHKSAESIRLYCTDQGSLFLRIIGQDFGFASDVTCRLYGTEDEEKLTPPQGLMLENHRLLLNAAIDVLQAHGTTYSSPRP